MKILRRIIRAGMTIMAAGLLHIGPASAADLSGHLTQGGMVIGRASPGASVRLDGAPVRVTPDGVFVLGFGRDAGPSASLEISHADGSTEREQLIIIAREFQIDRVDGLPERTVTVPPEEQERRRKERGLVASARAIDSDETFWVQPFTWPAEGRVSGVYGSQRILNGKPRSPHYGLDIAAPVDTPVHAPQAGTVVLADGDFLLEGGIVIIDHGYGVFSTLFHMQSVVVTVGQRVDRGQQIGTIGAKGRANGPHVDWRVNWRDVRLDPGLLVEGQQIVAAQ